MKRIPSLVGVIAIVVGFGLGACVSPQAGHEKISAPEDLLESGDRSFEGGRFAEASELYKMAAVAASNKKDGTLFVEAAAQVSSSLSLLGRSEDGRAWLNQAQEADDGSEQRAHARVLLASALHLRSTNQTAPALHAFDELYGYCTSMRWWEGAMQAATLASVVAEGQVRVDWCQRTLDAARSAAQPKWVAAAYESLGFAQEAVGDLNSAVGSIRESRKVTAPGSRLRLRSDWALAHMLRLTGKLAKAGSMLEAAIPVARRFHSQGYGPRDAEWLGRCFEEYAEVQAAMGRRRAALAAMKSARKAYMLAEIQSLAPQKLRALDARVAHWKYEMKGVNKQ